MEPKSCIKPIEKDAVHKICSGQVVLNLAIAVKELVENSLDAGATSIEIRLKEYGQNLIEVSDNGSGVEEHNFAGLTLKYHTSKLREFSDLLGVSTFGFRGEALSSLCFLSDVAITTRHLSMEHGTKITYDNKGHIVETTKCARQIGTTVSLSNLFKTLPVRQKEFHRNVKREFNKMTQILYAYCLVSVGVKFVCTNQINNGNKTVVVMTQGGSIRDNIASLFGVKQLQSLLEIKTCFPEGCTSGTKEKFFSDLENEKKLPLADDQCDIEDIKSDNELELSEESSNDALESSQANNCSQSSNFSQASKSSQPNRYNRCKPLEFSGFVSTCAHGSGRSTADRQFYFINSRPTDPHKIMKIFNDTYKHYNMNQYPFVFFDLQIKRSSVDVNVTPDKRKVFLEKEKYILEVVKYSLTKLYEHIPSTLKIENSNVQNFSQNIKASEESKSENTPRIFTSFLNQFVSKSAGNINLNSKSIFKEIKRKASCLDSFVKSTKPEVIEEPDIPSNKETLALIESNDPIDSEKTDALEESLNKNVTIIDPTELCDDNMDNLKEAIFLGYSEKAPLSQVVDIKDVIGCTRDEHPIPPKRIKTDTAHIPKNVIVEKSISQTSMGNRKTRFMNAHMDDIKRCMSDAQENQLSKRQIEKVKFRAQLDPVFNKRCEDELKKELNKDMFSKMKIIGQFNLGFIITQFEDDLFIIDQHASDEKFNYETLQKVTVLSNQKLVIPQSLELTGMNEKILIDNLEAFEMNGFTFEIDELAPPTKRVKLLTVPISKNHVFGKDDIEELLFLLKDSPQLVCRPSRVLAMFASRACRKSVMIGTALSKSIMRKLVDQMGTIEQPWNCPHGRPTIRHLINIGLAEI